MSFAVLEWQGLMEYCIGYAIVITILMFFFCAWWRNEKRRREAAEAKLRVKLGDLEVRGKDI
jgi:hypothetical protein